MSSFFSELFSGDENLGAIGLVGLGFFLAVLLLKRLYAGGVRRWRRAGW
ncbi:hypothetical protein [Nitrospirillum sp. BR 11163]|nr:hypothetical protein [Nitrospirillum sp. BR 11163]MEA1672006.1 hypothetical protein [Nitrospirillum sp. BR 11163]